VNSAIQELNKVIQSNAATAEEMAASSEELETQAIQLRETISFFNLGNEISRRNSTKSQTRNTRTANTMLAKSKLKNGVVLNLENENALDAEFEKFY